jgi:glucarate dehydratase
MKIVDISITSVNVPFEATLRWACGVETGTTRGIIEIVTEDGIIGLGETYGGAGIEHTIETARPFVIGLDVLDVGKLMHRFAVFCIGYETSVPAVVRAGIEMACLDAAGKSLGLPVYRLLGGKTRDRIEFGAYVFYRYRDPQTGIVGEDSPQAIAARTRELCARHGFRTIKLKGGVYRPAEELKALELIRADFPDAPLRWDPNAAWSVETSIRIAHRLLASGMDLEYLEDPTATLEGMSQVRKAVSIPLATNMCLVAWDQLAPGIRMRAVDVILSDLHYWGGFQQNRKMIAVAEAFNLGIGMHSDRELGISTSAMLHLAATTPYITYAIDSHYHDQVDDLITAPFVYEGGCMRVPDGPGLGVELDRDKLARYHAAYEKEGGISEFYDPARPDWIPALPLF